MVKAHFLARIGSVAILGALFAGCGIGLEPAQARSDTVVAIQVGDALTPSRAVLSTTGYLYLRTWPEAIGSGGTVYGPYAISGGQRFLTSDIPGRTYAALDVLFSADQIDLAVLNATSDFTSLAATVQGRASAARKIDEAIVPNQINELSVTLVPLVEDSAVTTLNPVLYTATLARSYSGATEIARFFKMDGMPIGVTTARLAIKATATDGAVSLALFGPSGNREKGFALDAGSGEWRLATVTAQSYYILVTGTASSFSLAVQAAPNASQANVTISFGNPAIPTVTGGPVTEVLSSDTITASTNAGYAEYVWKLNGKTVSSATGPTCAIDLSTTADSVVGANVVSLRVRTASGEYYSASFTFTMRY